MRAYEILTEAAASPHLVHLEDLVLDRGYAGAVSALKIADGVRALLSKGKGSKSKVTVKWDGCLHEDTILITENGNITIKDYVQTKSCEKVFGHDAELDLDLLVDVFGSYENDGEKDWINIELENGEVICLTEDHEVFTTNRGWVAAKDLQEGDDIKEPTVK